MSVWIGAKICFKNKSIEMENIQIFFNFYRHLAAMSQGFKKIGFISAWILPLLLIFGVSQRGIYLGMIHFFVFLVIPIMDYWVSLDKENVPKEAVSQVAKDQFYRVMTFTWVFIQVGVLIWLFFQVGLEIFSPWEYVLLVTGTALVTGGIGITVAHELGHKLGKWEQIAAKVLLMTVCYMHFIIEHNRGHHARVATPEDPATSRFGESFYAFWWRSVTQGFISAWQLEKERLTKRGKKPWSFQNQMIQFQLITISFILVLFLGFSFLFDRWTWEIPVFFSIQSVLAFSLLELVNYLEHYGMERRKLPTGRYENVNPLHSWNASQRISNFLLFQLQRHSDHHAFAAKPYQILDHHEESPQLPAGYSAMILVALVPPLWFKMMNPRLEKWRNQQYLISIQ